MFTVPHGVAPPRAAAAEHCARVEGGSGSYSVEICLERPTTGDVLEGEVTVEASVRASGAAAVVRRVVFYLDGEYLLTDFEAPYRFTLRTERFVDGSRLLGAEVELRDGTTSDRVTVAATSANGVVVPPTNTLAFEPSTGRTRPGSPQVVVAVGDGAGGEDTARAVTDRIATWEPSLFLYLGDVYEKGTPTEFHNWYGSDDTFFGRFRSITNPTVGDHEYEEGEAPGYFDYWDNIPDYYSFDAFGWHFVSLNSTGQLDQTSPGSAQYEWLRADLAANEAACTVAYFHHPALSIGAHGGRARMGAIWRLLADAGVDIALSGHDHNYQRWLALNGAYRPDPDGPIAFVVGTGGHSIRPFVGTDERVAAGFDRPPGAYGALRAQIGPGGAMIQFVNANGDVLDEVTEVCSGAPADSGPPTTVFGLNAEVSAASVRLTWDAAVDDIVVAGYRVYRDGEPLVEVDSFTLAYVDPTVQPGRSYDYALAALDPSQQESPPTSVSVDIPQTPPAEPSERDSLARFAGTALSWISLAVMLAIIGLIVWRGDRLGRRP